MAAMQSLGMGLNRCDHDAERSEGRISAQHPLATQEWLASSIMQKFAESVVNDVPALCELALINRNFLAAFKSDQLWLKLLPPASHLDFLFADQCDDADFVQFYRNSMQSKKALYQHLCRPISLAGGLQKFWLDRRTGQQCYMISARALTIIWGSTPQYWAWPRCSDAWFPEVACLRSVCWFEIKGKFRQPLRPGSYIVSFGMQIQSTSCWKRIPVKLSLRNLTSAHDSIKSCTFSQGQFPISSLAPLSSLKETQLPHHSTHAWIDCDVGEFTVEENDGCPVEVEFSMREIEVLNWKSGFLLDGVFIRPTNVVNALERKTMSIDDEGASYYYEEVVSVDDDEDEFVDGVDEDAEELSGDEEEANEACRHS